MKTSSAPAVWFHTGMADLAPGTVLLPRAQLDDATLAAADAITVMGLDDHYGGLGQA